MGFHVPNPFAEAVEFYLLLTPEDKMDENGHDIDVTFDDMDDADPSMRPPDWKYIERLLGESKKKRRRDVHFDERAVQKSQRATAEKLQLEMGCLKPEAGSLEDFEQALDAFP